MRRWVIRAVAALVAVVLVYFAVTFVQVWLTSRRDQARPVQAIVVLGAAQYDGRPSEVLRARLDHAVELFRRKLAPVIVVTGGRRPGDRFTEATAAADYLMAKGVPDDDILREVDGTSSWESLAAASEFLRERSIQRVLLVSDAFHSYRIAAIAEELGLDAYPSPTRTSPITGISATRHLARETAAVAVGRLIGYRREAGITQRVVESGQGSSTSCSARCSANRSAGALPE